MLRGQAKTDRLDRRTMASASPSLSSSSNPCQQRQKVESRRSLVLEEPAPSSTCRTPSPLLSQPADSRGNGFWCNGSWLPAAKMASQMSSLSKSVIIHAHGLWLVGLVVAGQGLQPVDWPPGETPYSRKGQVSVLTPCGVGVAS